MSSYTPSLDQPLASEPNAPAGEVDRWQHTRLRRRILYGQWREDLRARVARELQSEERADAWGEPDLSSDIFTPACAALAALYAPEPPRATGDAEVIAAAEAGGLWDIMVRLQRDTIGMREMVLAVEPDGQGGVCYRPVFPDRVIAYPAAQGPRDVPGRLAEAVFEARDGDDAARWYWHDWTIGDNPRWVIYPDDDRTNIVWEAGPDDLYYDDAGAPVMPYIVYHAERTGYLWDPYQWNNVVEGALRLGVLWTFYGHLIKNASWPQRYMLGAFVAGSSANDETALGRPQRMRVTADPAVVLTLVTDPESAASPSVGSFPPGADPLAVASSIELYERRIVGLAGLDAATVSRKDGDPRSGYALAVGQEARRELRDRFRPAFLRGDLMTLRATAAVLSSVRGQTYPSSGYGVEYGPVGQAPATPEETDALAA